MTQCIMRTHSLGCVWTSLSRVMGKWGLAQATLKQEKLSEHLFPSGHTFYKFTMSLKLDILVETCTPKHIKICHSDISSGELSTPIMPVQADCLHCHSSPSVKQVIQVRAQLDLYQKGGDLPACFQIVPTSAYNWYKKSKSMCNHVNVIMHVKDP